MTDDAPQPPDLYAYLDYRTFLSDWFAWKKAANPRFSHRMFARLAGFKSSSVLLNAMRGVRNLSPTSVHAFARAMKLDDDEVEFFAALVDLEQASEDGQRNDAWERISAQRRFREARRMDGEGFRYFSRWYYSAVRELAARDDFRADPAWVAARLRPRIAEAEAADTLDALQSLGLLVPDEAGRLRPAEASVVTAAEVFPLAVCNYHREMSMRAHDAVAAFEREERHLLGVTVAIPERLVPVLKEELNRIQARLLDLCDSAEEPVDRVYQINLQLVPLSDGRGDA